jgi:cell division protein FtsQ
MIKVTPRPSQRSRFTPAFVGGVLFFLLSLWLVVWCLQQVWQWGQQQQSAPIQQVRLIGDFKHIKPQQLQAQLQQAFVGNFFQVNVDQVQQYLQQQPWVYHTAVRKQWPGVLVLVITEHQPRAVWNNDYLLNDAGMVFKAPLQDVTATLPRLAGPAGTEQDTLAMYEQVQSLLKLHRFEASALTLSERFAWQVTLTSGIELKLGREDTLKRVQRFIELYPEVSKHKAEPIEQVDLRYDTGIAVKFAAPVITEKRKA